jgi:hypothetical protein
MRPIMYYTIYDFNIVFLAYDDVYYDNYTVVESLFREQSLYKRFYQTFLIGA